MGSNSGWPLFFSTALVCVLILLTVGTWNHQQPLKQFSLWLAGDSQSEQVADADSADEYFDDTPFYIYEPIDVAPRPQVDQNDQVEPANAQNVQTFAKIERKPLKRRRSVPAPIAIIPDFDPPAELNSPARVGQNDEDAGQDYVANDTGRNKVPAKNAVFQSTKPAQMIQGSSVKDDKSTNKTKTFGQQHVADQTSKNSFDPVYEASVWPEPTKLNDQLDQIIFDSSLSQWKMSLIDTLAQLQQLNSLADVSAGVILSQLDDQANFLLQHIEALENENSILSSQQLNFIVQLKHLQYQLTKRTQLWKTTHQLALAGIKQPSALQKQAAKTSAFALAQETKRFAADRGWCNYLLLDQAIEIFAARQTTDPRATRLAQIMLLRLYSPVLNDQQWQYAHELIDEDFKRELKTIALENIDLAKLLRQIELMEAKTDQFNSAPIAKQYQQLLWMDSDAALKVAHAIETHYRNANIRIACHTSMLSQLLFNDIPQGNTGLSHGGEKVGSANNASGWSLRMHDNQTSLASFNVNNSSSSRDIQLKKHFFSRSPEIQAQRNSFYDSLEMLTDSIPVFENAKARYEKVVGKQRMTTNFASVGSIDQQFHSAIADHLSAPLAAIGLEPRAIDMQSNSSRLMIRGRIAGADQLAAYTARPKAIDNCAASMQIHESFINNLLAKSLRTGQINTFASLKERVTETIGVNLFDDSTTRFDAANCHLASADAIRFKIDDNEIQVHIDLVHNKENYSICVYYRASLINGNIVLTQLPHKTTVIVSAIGRNAQQQFNMIGELFAKSISIGSAGVFQQRISENLRIGQFVVNEGWIGISWLYADKVAMERPVQRR